MNEKKLQVVVIVQSVVILILLAYIFKPAPKVDREKPQGENCEVTTETFKMNDEFMKGIFDPDQELTVEKNYYACNLVEKGDKILFSISKTMDPVVRQVVAVEGDEFELIPTKDKNGWNIKVNGSLFKVNGDPYYFGSTVKPVLALYTKDGKKGKLNKDNMIIFSNVPPGSKDSGYIGLTNRVDILGRIKQ